MNTSTSTAGRFAQILGLLFFALLPLISFIGAIGMLIREVYDARRDRKAVLRGELPRFR